MGMSKEDLLLAALMRLQEKHGTFDLSLPFTDVVILIGQLQLALRHPGNARLGVAGRTRTIVEGVIAALDACDPGGRRPAAAGFRSGLRRGGHARRRRPGRRRREHAAAGRGLATGVARDPASSEGKTAGK
jgi:hypothetical protein